MECKGKKTHKFFIFITDVSINLQFHLLTESNKSHGNMEYSSAKPSQIVTAVAIMYLTKSFAVTWGYVIEPELNQHAVTTY
jgi:hypothetical protein